MNGIPTCGPLGYCDAHERIIEQLWARADQLVHAIASSALTGELAVGAARLCIISALLAHARTVDPGWPENVPHSIEFTHPELRLVVPRA